MTNFLKVMADHDLDAIVYNRWSINRP
jgi:hypothetical protein